jgi:hypothetical protein
LTIGAGYAISVEDILEKLNLQYNIICFLKLDLINENKEFVKSVIKPSDSFLLSFMDMLYAIFRATTYNDFAYTWLRRTESYTIEGKQHRTLER